MPPQQSNYSSYFSGSSRPDSSRPSLSRSGNSSGSSHTSSSRPDSSRTRSSHTSQSRTSSSRRTSSRRRISGRSRSNSGSALFSKQNLSYIIILGLFILFMATIGIQFIVNTALYVAGIDSSDTELTTNSRDDTSVLIAPELYDIPDATNSAKINITGIATKGLELTIFVNGDEQDSMKLKDDDFDATISLDTGKNTIYAELKDSENNRAKDSDTYTTFLITGKPSLEITSPDSNSTVYTQSVVVAGKTDEGVNIRINNSPVVVSADGSFKKTIRLKEGDNQILVTAEDVASNVTEKEFSVKYERDE